MGFEVFVKDFISGKTLTVDLKHASDTTGLQMKQILCEHPGFPHIANAQNFILLFANELFADDHHLYDHRVTKHSTLLMMQINHPSTSNKAHALIAKHQQDLTKQNEPSSRLSHLISGYMRDASRQLFPDLTKCVLSFLGHKFATFEVDIYDKTYRVSEKWLVKNLKQKIQCTPYHALKYNDITLANYRTLEYYGIVYRGDGEMKPKLKYYCHQLYIKTLTGKLYVLDLRTLDITVLLAKQALFQQEGVNVDGQKWMWHGREMQDTENLKSDYHVTRNTVILLILRR